MTGGRVWTMGWFVALLATTIAAEQPSGVKTVTAVGKGAGPDAVKARDDALADAQRRAVEQGAGLYVKSSVLVENAALVSSRISTQAHGILVGYKLLGEERDEDGVTTVRIEAQVALDKLEQAVRDVCSEMKLAGDPRVLLNIESSDKLDEGARRAVTATLREGLVRQGVIVIDASQLDESKQRLLQRLSRQGKGGGAEAMKLQDDADIIIKGEASARELGHLTPGLDVNSSEAAVDLFAVWTDNARIIASQRAKERVAALNQGQASERALEAAAAKWLDDSLCDIKMKLVDPAKTFVLNVTGVDDLDSIDQMVEKLGAARFTRGTRIRSFDSGAAVVEVTYASSSTSLRKELRNAGFSVTGLTTRTLNIRPTKRAAKG